MPETEMFRVVYEQRKRPRCNCCEYREAEAMEHQFAEATEGPWPRLRDAEEAETRLYDATEDRNGFYEYRNIRIQRTTSEWKDVR